MLRKRYTLNWSIEAPDAILTCSILKCRKNNDVYIAFGGHDKNLYLMDFDLTIIDDIAFDGWCRCSYAIDLDGDDNDELLVGSGDGTCLVLELDPETKKLSPLMKYVSEGKITSCVAGEFYQNGKDQFIFGGEDKTVKIFSSLKSKKPDFILYYDSWVMCCELGYLKLKNKPKPIFGLLVGTKSGILQFIQVITKNNKQYIDIIWQRDVKTQINAMSIGDVTNSGYNEIVIGTNDSYLKILDGNGDNVRYIKVDNGKSVSSSRPLAILIDDIDGDNSKEMIIGCADGNLRIYHNTELDSTYFEQKWKTKVSTSIKHICPVEDLDDPEKKHFIFGGYDRTLRHVTDFKWGEKPFLKIPVKFRPKPIEKEKIDTKTLEIKDPIPTNIREYVIYYLKKYKFIISLKLLKELLLKEGYAEDLIEAEVSQMEKEGVIIKATPNNSAWTLSTEDASELLKKKPVSMKKIEEDGTVTELTQKIQKVEEKEKEKAPIEKKKARKKPSFDTGSMDLLPLAEYIHEQFVIRLDIEAFRDNLANVNLIRTKLEAVSQTKPKEPERKEEPKEKDKEPEERKEKTSVPKTKSDEKEGPQEQVEEALMEEFEKETGKNAIWRGKITQNFLDWKEEKYGS